MHWMPAFAGMTVCGRTASARSTVIAPHSAVIAREGGRSSLFKDWMPRLRGA